MSAQKAWWVYAERSAGVYTKVRRVVARSALAAAHLAWALDPKATGKDRLLAFRETYLAERFRKRGERGWLPPRRLAVAGGGTVGDPLRIEAVPEPAAGEHGERDEDGPNFGAPGVPGPEEEGP
jgi:hypothetical protein